MCNQKYLIYRYKTREGSDDRYKIQVIAGYAVPLLFVILAVIVEASAPRCSKWKPRFLEGVCFFAGIIFKNHELTRHIQGNVRIKPHFNTQCPTPQHIFRASYGPACVLHCEVSYRRILYTFNHLVSSTRGPQKFT